MKKTLKKILNLLRRYILWPVIFLLVGAYVASIYLIGTGKEINANVNWFGSENGIDVTEFVEIGGISQYIRIRGRNRDNPIMLDLHGGPGGAQSGITHRSLRPLTEYFTVVEWDQRGAGKTGGGEEIVGTMNYGRMVADTVELIEHLRERFGVDKVVLVGHSWGSMLGIGVVQKRPDLIAAYVGVGQALAWNKAFDETARLLLEAAEAAGDQETVDALTGLPDEWPAKEDYEANFERIVVIQGPLGKYGGGMYAAHSTDMLKSDIVLDAITSPDMPLSDIMSVFSPSEATNALVTDLYDRDFRTELGTNYKVPMFIFQGEHDWQTPTTLVKPWFAELTAPHKEYIAFEDSAHLVFTEEPGKYLFEMVNRVRPFAIEEKSPMIDHVILLVSDLEAFAPAFETQTGVALTEGGAHPGLGTANLLASLGDGMYLEVLGPDPELDEPEGLGQMLTAITEPQLAWCAGSMTDMASLGKQIADAGFQAAGPSDGSRETPEGTTLRWQGMIVADHPFGDLMPFFIDWKDTPHPGETSAQGIELVSMTAYHPDADELRKAYDAIGVRIAVEQRDIAGYELSLDTPNGPLIYRSEVPEAFFQPFMAPPAED